jgi:ubiquitin-conjugating enzyme E2 J2
MSSGSGGVSVTAAARLRKDYMRLIKDPVPLVLAAPLPSNILEWFVIYCYITFKSKFILCKLRIHFAQYVFVFMINSYFRHYCVRGAPDTAYEGGTYHGKLVFPADFPFKPPSIYMITPNGRFQV